MKLIYKPFGVVLGLLAGFLGRKLCDRLSGLVDDQDPPKPTTQRATGPTGRPGALLGLGQQVEQDSQLGSVVELARQQRQGVGLQDRAQLVLGEPEKVHQAARAVGAGVGAQSSTVPGPKVSDLRFGSNAELHVTSLTLASMRRVADRRWRLGRPGFRVRRPPRRGCRDGARPRSAP